MATLQDLEGALDNLLQQPFVIERYVLLPHVAEKAYEAYLFGLCLRAVRELGATPVLRGISGAPNLFIFRGAPGQIHSTYRNYGYACFELNHYKFEIHSGVVFKGTSGMTHELDVAIMRAADADRCRRIRDDPKSASVIAAWECKFYAGTLEKSLGRQFVGLIDDMSASMRLCGLCANVDSQQLKTYFSPRRRPFPHFMLTPLEPSNEEIFVNQLKGELKKLSEV